MGLVGRARPRLDRSSATPAGAGAVGCADPCSWEFQEERPLLYSQPQAIPGARTALRVCRISPLPAERRHGKARCTRTSACSPSTPGSRRREANRSPDRTRPRRGACQDPGRPGRLPPRRSTRTHGNGPRTGSSPAPARTTAGTRMHLGGTPDSLRSWRPAHWRWRSGLTGPRCSRLRFRRRAAEAAGAWRFSGPAPSHRRRAREARPSAPPARGSGSKRAPADGRVEVS